MQAYAIRTLAKKSKQWSDRRRGKHIHCVGVVESYRTASPRLLFFFFVCLSLSMLLSPHLKLKIKN
jgi:hypothetical protein